jgi:hypothetical protein
VNMKHICGGTNFLGQYQRKMKVDLRNVKPVPPKAVMYFGHRVQSRTAYDSQNKQTASLPASIGQS